MNKMALPRKAARLAKKKRGCELRFERKFLQEINALHPPAEFMYYLDRNISERQKQGGKINIIIEITDLIQYYRCQQIDYMYMFHSIMHRFIAACRLTHNPKVRDCLNVADEDFTGMDHPFYLAAIEEKLFYSDDGEVMSFEFNPDRFIACVQRIRQEAAAKLAI